jgi:hypothetical protein
MEVIKFVKNMQRKIKELNYIEMIRMNDYAIPEID